MRRQQTRAAVFVLVGVLAASAGAATRAYFVEPKEYHVGWTPEDEFVGQAFVANIDSISYIEWFVAEPNDSGQYEFEILEDGQHVCGGKVDVPAQGWKWIRCENFTGDLQFTKGKEYVLKVSHSTDDSGV